MKILSTTLEDIRDIDTLAGCGCDEVIIAAEGCSISALHEFNDEEIEKITDLCHHRGMRVSVLSDRLFSEKETETVCNRFRKWLGCEVDYVMFADLCLMKAAVEEKACEKMIYRSFTMSVSAADARFFLEQGASSVVISPLLTKEETTAIAMNIEHCSLIIHGHTLMSVSKRKLLDAYVQASGKEMEVKGRRDLKLREDHRKEYMPVYENAYVSMIYSDYVLDSFDEMHDFMRAGVERYEIDSVFLQKEAVFDAVRAYRQILDGTDVQAGEKYRKRYAELPLSEGYYELKTIK